MINKKTSIIYISHGPKHLHKQSIFSILTLSHHLNFDFSNLDIIVYTDDKKIFETHLKGVPLKFEFLSKERLKEFMKYDFVHRAKICVIQDCMEKYNTNILYVDGDTYFLRSPEELINTISKDNTVLHQFEFTIDDGGDIHEVPIWLTLRKLAKRHEYTLNGESFKLSFDSQMWNAGVIGIGIDNYQYVADVLDLSDQLTVKSKFKTAEQFSFSYVMKKHSTLIPADDFIYHYWQAGLKILYNYHIDVFLKKNLQSSIKIKSQNAIELYKSQGSLSVPDMTLLERINLRCKLIWKVTKHGHL